MPGITVRPARRDDLEELVGIYNHYVERSHATFDAEPATVEGRLAWFQTFSDTGPHRLVVGAKGAQILGFASSSPYRTRPAFSRTVELSVYVHPHARGQGVGAALYSTLIDALQSEDVHLAVAGIALPNDASVALHLRFGFTEVGVFDEYATKGGAYISSLWLQRRL